MEYTKDGKIKDFSVPDAHHLYVTAKHSTNGMVLRKEAIALREPAELKELATRVDPDDGLTIGKKWALTPEVIKALLENGDCYQRIPGHSIYFEYVLKPMRYKDNLKHKG